MSEPDSYDGETWKPLEGYEGVYLVSNLGRVWSVRRPARRPRLPSHNAGDHRYVRWLGGHEVTVRKGKRGRFIDAQTGVSGRTVRVYL